MFRRRPKPAPSGTVPIILQAGSGFYAELMPCSDGTLLMFRCWENGTARLVARLLVDLPAHVAADRCWTFLKRLERAEAANAS